MKKIYLTLLTILSLSLTFSQDLILTGAVDGTLSGGIPRALELYVASDIADLSIYGIDKITNGAGTSGSAAWNFPADAVTTGDFIYVTKDSLSFYTYFGFDADYITSEINGNGDDAYEIYNGSTVVDVFGIETEDGSGRFWDYLDGWSYRNDATGPDANVMDTFAWTFSGINELDGAATNADASNPWPLGTFSNTPPPSTDIYFKIGSATVNEDAGVALLLDSLIWGFPAVGTESIEIHIQTGNTATDGTDFQTPPATLLGSFPITIPFALVAGQSSAPFALDILEDLISDGTENVTFVIKNTTGFTVGSDSTFALTILDNDFTTFDIADITTEDAVTGEADSLGLQCKIVGVVNSKDRGFNSLEFSMQDATGAITVYTADAAFQTLDPQVGDEYEIIGEVSLYNGVVSFENIVSMINTTSGNVLTPTIEMEPNDANESSLIRINDLEIIDPSTWNNSAGGAGFTVQALNTSGDTINIRIDRDYDDLYNSSAPSSNVIDIIGVASQYDPSSPHDENFQILPRELTDIILKPTLNMTQQGTSVNEDAGTVTINFEIVNDDGGSYTVDVELTSGDATDIDNFATQTAVAITSGAGSITVNITDDSEIESSEVFVFELTNASNGLLVGSSTFELTVEDNDADAIKDININSLNIYPNPSSNFVNVEMHSNENQLVNVSLTDLTGRKVIENIYTLNNGKNIITLDLSKLTTGNYIINLSTEKGSHTDSIMVK